MEVIFTSWPFCTLIFFIIFIIVFRNGIINLIGRTKSISKEGLIAAPALEQQIQEQVDSKKSEENEKKNVEVLSDIVLNAIVKQFPFIQLKEKEISNEISKISSPAGGKEPLLIRILAIAWATNECEVIYREIMGSQIRMLIYLNGNQNLGKTQEELIGFYKQYSLEDEEREKKYLYVNYMAWMLWKGLLLFKEDEGLLYITDIGRYFLNHIISKGYDVNKPF